MTKYTDNEQYEKDKKIIINMLIDSGFRTAANILKQSKWVGADNQDKEIIRPIPVVKDKRGKLIQDYDQTDWLIAIQEEYKEATEQIILEDKTRAAEELQDLKHVCTTMQHWLGFDDKAIDELCAETNAKNQRRGYFKEE